MRNIKNKAWVNNLDLNEYILQDVLRLDFFLDTKTLAKIHTKSFRQRNPFNLALDNYDYNKAELLEFTENYDINGNEIYTGYIVSFTASKRNYIGVVEWDKNSASYVLKAKDHYNKYFNEVDNLKVIGNIYENKELLDETIKI